MSEIKDGVPAAPQPAQQERKRRYAQGTALGELGITPMCDQVDDQAAEPVSQHPDDAAVDAFAAAMKAKLAKKRSEGRGGWQECSAEYLSDLLRSHVEKGDPVDVANFAMMMHQNGQRIEPVKVPSDDLAHEIWAAAQLAPGEGIVDGVARVEALLRKVAHPAITHCDNCGCDWLDNGLNPVGCPYCNQSAEIEALRAEVEKLRDDGASAVRWAPGSAYWSAVLKELFGPDARKGIDVLESRWRAALERADTAEALLRRVLEAVEEARNALYEGHPIRVDAQEIEAAMLRGEFGDPLER